MGLRVGLNSGPVTAGVLRGERSRFQLFGDTVGSKLLHFDFVVQNMTHFPFQLYQVNTAARMESNGAPNRIHISKETADLLLQAGKHSWVRAREDKIVAKGKGELQTYWLETKKPSESRKKSSQAEQAPSSGGDGSENNEEMVDNDPALIKSGTSVASGAAADKISRLVKWNTELLAQSLQKIIARRIDTGVRPADEDTMLYLEEKSRRSAQNGNLVLDEVVEIIDLPQKALALAPGEEPTDPDLVELKPEVVAQLHDYVRTIAAMYRTNPFHNFEHASHDHVNLETYG